MSSVQEKFVDNLSKYKERWWLVPLTLFLVCLGAYGLVAPKLGFYWDDWLIALVFHSKLNFWEYFKYDRPFSAWTHIVFFPLLGSSPKNWHFFMLILKWATSWGVYKVIHQIWPQRRREALFASLIFAIHPVFKQQAIALSYSQHFITYGLFLLSIITMLAALNSSRWRKVAFSTLSIVATVGHLFTMEYFWSLELLRPLLLWLVISRNDEKENLRKIPQIIKIWIPYLLATISAFIWRYFLIDIPADPNELSTLYSIRANFVKESLKLLQTIMRDSIHLLISSWYKVLEPELIDLTEIRSWLLVIFIALVVYLAGYQFENGKDRLNSSSRKWRIQFLGFGLLAVVLGMLPGWIVGRAITVGLFSDRIAIPALFGVSIVLVGLVDSMIAKRKYQLALISILVGLAVGAQFRIGLEYKQEWDNQRDFYWQLYWRVPSLKENTAILSDGAIFPHTADYPTASAINVLYSRKEGNLRQPYWFFEVDDSFYFRDMTPLLEGLPIEYRIRNITFSGNGYDNVSIWYQPPHCLWVLSEHEASNSHLPWLTVDTMHVSNMDRIDTDPEVDNLPPKDVFGPEPPHTWCYYFQKADIAYLESDWDKIIDLRNEATAQGFEPNNNNELYPFIEAYARTGNWEIAQELTINAFTEDVQTRSMFCTIWQGIKPSVSSDAKPAKIVADTINFLDCLAE